jgi:ribosome biogenesis GTPase
MTVETPDGRRLGCMASGRGKAAVVGDRVRLEGGREGQLVVEVAPRETEFVRADALGRRAQVLAANVTRVFVVCAVEPPLREGLIDRYIVAAERAGAEAHVVFNKLDLLDDDEELDEEVRERLAVYPPLGYPVHFASAHDGRGIDGLRAAIVGQTGIFVGHSGVGKTSLLNALDPGLGERVQELSEGSGRGRHTTTTSALYRLPGGGEIIDSPGVRAFGLWGIEPDEVKLHFVEFGEYAQQCKFANCTHDHEPGCAVVDAVEAGHIHPERYESYLRIRDSLLHPER